jgi:hypothetical protein
MQQSSGGFVVHPNRITLDLSIENCFLSVHCKKTTAAVSKDLYFPEAKKQNVSFPHTYVLQSLELLEV